MAIVGAVLLYQAKREMPLGFRLRTSVANLRARRFYEREALRPDREELHPNAGDPVAVYVWSGLVAG